jgi:hypothetical protein
MSVLLKLGQWLLATCFFLLIQWIKNVYFVNSNIPFCCMKKMCGCSIYMEHSN